MTPKYDIVILEAALQEACQMAFKDKMRNRAWRLFHDIQFNVTQHLWDHKGILYKWRLRQIAQVIAKHNQNEFDLAIDVSDFFDDVSQQYKEIAQKHNIEYDDDLIKFLERGAFRNTIFPRFEFSLDDNLDA